jgi:hypothetical protein
MYYCDLCASVMRRLTHLSLRLYSTHPHGINRLHHLLSYLGIHWNAYLRSAPQRENSRRPGRESGVGSRESGRVATKQRADCSTCTRAHPISDLLAS